MAGVHRLVSGDADGESGGSRSVSRVLCVGCWLVTLGWCVTGVALSVEWAGAVVCVGWRRSPSSFPGAEYYQHCVEAPSTNMGGDSSMPSCRIACGRSTCRAGPTVCYLLLDGTLSWEVVSAVVVSSSMAGVV